MPSLLCIHLGLVCGSQHPSLGDHSSKTMLCRPLTEGKPLDVIQYGEAASRCPLFRARLPTIPCDLTGSRELLMHGSMTLSIVQSLKRHPMRRFKRYGRNSLLWTKTNLWVVFIYRQHKSPDRFLAYWNETMENFTGKMSAWWVILTCLLKTQTSRYSHEFVMTLIQHTLNDIIVICLTQIVLSF